MLSSNNNLLMGTQVNDMIRDIPHHQTHYLGLVHSTFDEKDDDDNDIATEDRCYKIRFNVLGLPAFTEKWPVAVPLGNSTRPVREGDLVKIWDVCESSVGMHTFFYEPIYEDHFTGLKNFENYIDLTEKNIVTMKFPNTTITYDKSGGDNTNRNDTDDNTQGEVKIEAGGSSITINCVTGGIEVKAKSGSTIKINGTTATGFNCIAACPYTGATHTTNTVITQ